MQPRRERIAARNVSRFYLFHRCFHHLATFHSTRPHHRKYRSKSRYERDLASAPASELKMSLSQNPVSTNEFSGNQRKVVSLFCGEKGRCKRHVEKFVIILILNVTRDYTSIPISNDRSY